MAGSRRAAGPRSRPPAGPAVGVAAPLIAVVALFVVSGAAGLVYEVIWTRSLTSIFGKTVHAVSAVLAAYMAGLALGSAVGGRLIDRSRANPLRIYALLEAGIAAWALALPAVLAGVGALYAALAEPFEHPPATLGAMRFVLATIALMPATTFMGATLPALARWAVRTQAHVASRLGLLYSLNTLGAVAGCAAAGFFFIELLGLAGATLVAVAGNLVVAALALLLSRRAAPAREVEAAARQAPGAPPAGDGARGWALAAAMAAVFLSGFGSLVLEVVWTRILMLVYGSTVYSFTTMLTVFLAGIGLGSLLMTPFADRLRSPWLVLGLLQGGIAVLVLASAHAVDGLPAAYLRMLSWWGLTWQVDVVVKFLLSAALMLLPTLLSGAVWPVAVRLVRPSRDRIGSGVGALYAASTLGSIAGSVSGAFGFLPLLGMQYSMVAVSLILAAAGAGLVILDRRSLARRAVPALVIVALSGAIAIGLQPWDRKRLTSGAYFMPAYYLDDQGEPQLEEKLAEAELLYYAEGLTTTPTVMLLGEVNKAFFNDGKIEGGTAMDGRRLIRLIGHLPFLLMRGEAETALNIGLGSGITVGAMGVHPVPRIDCAEIEPVVVGAARMFDPETYSILDRPGFRMIYNDGRNHLMLTDQTYDVMASMPIAPLIEGSANVFSREHFALARSRLAPGGMIAQWVPMYELSPTDYRGIMRTFAEVFPDATVWFTGIETILLGSHGPQEIDYATLAQRMRDPKVAQSLRDIGLDDPMRLLSTYCFRLSEVADDLAQAPISTDDRPRIEFSAPRSHLVNTVKDNLPWLIERRRSPLPLIRFPADWPADDPRRAQLADRLDITIESQRLMMEGRLRMLRGDLVGSITDFEAAVSTDPGDIYARDLASRNLVKLGDRLIDQGVEDDGIRAYERALAHDPGSFLALYNLAGFDYARGDLASAWKRTAEALRIAPGSPSLNYRMGLLLYNRGDYDRSAGLMKRALDRDPGYPDPYMVLGDIEGVRGDAAAAAEMYRRAIAAGKDDAEAHAALAQACVGAGRIDEALGHLEDARARAPQDPEVNYTQAAISAARGDRARASSALAAAIAAGGDRYRQKALADPALAGLVGGDGGDAAQEGPGR